MSLCFEKMIFFFFSFFCVSILVKRISTSSWWHYFKRRNHLSLMKNGFLLSLQLCGGNCELRPDLTHTQWEILSIFIIITSFHGKDDIFIKENWRKKGMIWLLKNGFLLSLQLWTQTWFNSCIVGNLIE